MKNGLFPRKFFKFCSNELGLMESSGNGKEYLNRTNDSRIIYIYILFIVFYIFFTRYSEYIQKQNINLKIKRNNSSKNCGSFHYSISKKEIFIELHRSAMMIVARPSET